MLIKTDHDLYLTETVKLTSQSGCTQIVQHVSWEVSYGQCRQFEALVTFSTIILFLQFPPTDRFLLPEPLTWTASCSFQEFVYHVVWFYFINKHTPVAFYFCLHQNIDPNKHSCKSRIHFQLRISISAKLSHCLIMHHSSNDLDITAQFAPQNTPPGLGRFTFCRLTCLPLISSRPNVFVYLESHSPSPANPMERGGKNVGSYQQHTSHAY